MGSVVVSCPIEAAATLAAASRLEVGWCCAAIRVLEQRPMRCHKCLEKGHTQQLCPSNKDRSGLCYRCGQEGHVAKSCALPYRCAVCADRGRPSAHRMAGPSCDAPPVKGRASPATTAVVPADQVAAAHAVAGNAAAASATTARAAAAHTATREVTPMDINNEQ